MAKTPLQLVTQCLERIEQHRDLNAFITVLADEALAVARAGRPAGPLSGMPIGIKDFYDTAGIKTTAAAQQFANRIPKRDAVAVAQLKRAGAIVVGKTNLHELGMGTTSLVSYFGPVQNPINPDYIAGGSSGGSAAAVATGMCVATLDTDAVGSCRLPAACCGVVGFKPTYGLVSTQGILDGEPDAKAPFDNPGFDIRNIEADRKAIAGRLFKDVDVLVLPTTKDKPPTVKAATGNPLALPADYTMFANYYGLPAISIPFGEDDGMPLGLQIVGRPHEDDVVLRLASALERST